MIGVGGAVLIAILMFAFIVVFIVLLNKEPSQHTTVDYSPRSIFKIMPGKDFKQANCEIDYMTGNWIYTNPNNKDINFVKAKSGGLFNKLYDIDFNPDDQVILEGRQGKCILTGIKNLNLVWEKEKKVYTEKIEFLENLNNKYENEINNLTMKKDLLIEKEDEKAKNKLIIPYVKPQKQPGGKY